MEAKLQDMNSILRKVVPQGVTAAANSCREQISFIFILLVFCGERVYWDSALAVLPPWDSCMALLAGAHTWQCWRSSLPLSFCPLVASFSISFTLCFNQLSLQLCFKTIDIHLWVWDRGFGLCRRHCFLLFFLFFFLPVRLSSRSSADHRALFCPVYAVIHV